MIHTQLDMKHFSISPCRYRVLRGGLAGQLLSALVMLQADGSSSMASLRVVVAVQTGSPLLDVLQICAHPGHYTCACTFAGTSSGQLVHAV